MNIFEYKIMNQIHLQIDQNPVVTVSDLSPINKDTINEGDKVNFAKQNENTFENNKAKKQSKKGSYKEPKIVKEKENFIIEG